MIIINWKGNKEKRENPGITVSRNQDNVYAYFEKRKNSVSLLIIEVKNKKAKITECAVFTKRGISCRRSILAEKFLQIETTNLNDGTAIMRELYGNYVPTGFNHLEYLDENVLKKYIYFMALPSADFKGIKFKKISEIKNESLQNLARLSVTLTAAYIENLGEGKSAIRLFQGKGGEITEVGRIVTDRNESSFYFLINNRFCVDRKPDLFFFDFTICGSDDLSGTLIEHICKGSLVFNSVKICMSLQSGAFENLWKMSMNNIIEYILDDSDYTGIDIKLKDAFGNLNYDAKSFSKMIGFPYMHLKIIDSHKEIIPYCSTLKLLLGEETIKSMNHQKFQTIVEKILEAFDTIGIKPDSASPFNDYLSSCIETFGVRNFEGYINNIINKNVTWKNVRTYTDYINLIHDFHLKQYGFKWKVKQEKLQELHQRAVDIANLITAEEDEKEYGSQFKSVRSNMKRYEYKGDSISVIVPESITDIVKEGQKLGHCVRTYISKLINGETNILFIRKNSDLQTPYYTLEIRNETIRQCHGMQNKNPDRDLDTFLKKYAAEKCIKYTKTDEALLA